MGNIFFDNSSKQFHRLHITREVRYLFVKLQCVAGFANDLGKSLYFYQSETDILQTLKEMFCGTNCRFFHKKENFSTHRKSSCNCAEHILTK